MSLPSFLTSLAETRFGDERTQDAVKANRLAICESVRAHLGAQLVCAWISYRTPQVTSHYCYYVTGAGKIVDPAARRVTILESASNDNDDAEALERATRKIFALSPKLAVKAYPARNIFAQVATGHPKVLGWLVVGGPTAEAADVETIGRVAALVLSHHVDRGRISRTRSANDALRRALTKAKARDAVLVGTDFLQRSMKFEAAIVYDKSGMRAYSVGDPALIAAAGVSNDHFLDAHDPSDAPGSQVRPFHFDRGPQKHLVPQSASDSIAIHLNVPAYQFSDEKFQPAWTVDARLQLKRSLHSTIVLLRRNDPTYFGEIGPTEIALCQYAVEALEAGISEQQYESSLSRLHGDLANLSRGPLDADEVLQLALIISPNIKAAFAFNYDQVKGRLVDTGQRREPHGLKLPGEYVTRLNRTAKAYVETHRNGFPDEARVGLALSGGRRFLEFHLSNAYEPARFFIFEFDGETITREELRMFRHFVTELAIRWRNFDSSEERRTLFAQIRHAIIDPIAAADNALDYVHRQNRYSRTRPTAWAELRSDDVYAESIEKALYLVSQAKMLAETGRYLFANLAFADLRTDHYDISVILQQLLMTFSHQIKLRRLTSRQVVSGRRPGRMTGDALLLWVALANLVDNAVKYSRSGSTLTVALEYSEDSYTVRITNEGPYLRPDLHDVLFTPYRRGPQKDLLNKKHGTGIGLPVAAMILKAHSDQADLRYTSDPTVGTFGITTFFFEMPYLIGRSGRPTT